MTARTSYGHSQGDNRMSLFNRLTGAVGAGALASLAFAGSALAQEAEAAESTIVAGDTAWMLISTVLVTMMAVPAIGLFYGGLVRSKNMASVLTQTFGIFCVGCLVWLLWGYSLAFTANSSESLNNFIGGFDALFLAGVTPEGASPVLSNIPDYVFICFQMTFAALTAALIVGGFAERVKYSGLLLFSALWITLVYVPICHMVWGGGYLGSQGAFDFAGGTVVHINAGVAALVGAFVIGKRVGFGKEAMPPHSLTMTMIGASLLWVGWFGFNAGSAGAADGNAGLAMVTTFGATAAAALGWQFVEWMTKGHPSLLGLVSGAIAGLVAVTPAAGFVGPMGAIILGLIAGVLCFFACTAVKNALKYDESLDVFGVHGVGGIVGALGVAIFAAPGLGGTQDADYDMFAQLLIQAEGVAITIVYCGVVSAILFYLAKAIFGIRVTEEQEREGLDISSHGERAYN